jgi:signal transduction histidine kinase
VTVRLPVRLFGSYALVIAMGAATAFVTVRLLAPRLFDQRMQMTTPPGHMPGSGQRYGGGAGTPHAALVSAVNTALVVAVLVSILAAGAVAGFVTSRLLRPLKSLRTATRRIAAGRYDGTVPLPREPELAALAADVNTLAGSLARTEQRRTRLLGDVAHEMRTPLTALDGYVEGLLDGVFSPTAENLHAMAEELHRLHRLADDLSTLSRTEENRLELHLVDADLGTIARAAAGRLRPQFEDAGVALQVRDHGPAPVHVDVDRITQVLTNLLGNALLATDAAGSVDVDVAVGADSAVASVRDTGIGFRAEDRERIFERFYRVAAGRRRSPGSGVGLTIARGLATAHGGELRADSDGPGLGATFTVTLPRRTNATVKEEP